MLCFQGNKGPPVPAMFQSKSSWEMLTKVFWRAGKVCGRDTKMKQSRANLLLSGGEDHRPLKGPFRGAVFHHGGVWENSPLA